MSPRPRDSLPIGTVLDCYRVTKLIGSGGFSLSYLAEDEDSHDEMAIKEYLPKRFGARDEGAAVTVLREDKYESFQRGRRLFYQEARLLATLRHPNIVHVRNCFLANNTAYLVMNYEPGKNLGRYIKKRQGGLSTNFIAFYLIFVIFQFESGNNPGPDPANASRFLLTVFPFVLMVISFGFSFFVDFPKNDPTKPMVELHPEGGV